MYNVILIYSTYMYCIEKRKRRVIEMFNSYNFYI